MPEPRNGKSEGKKWDTHEFELPDTTFVSNIDNNVFKGIVLQCLSQIEGISFVAGNFIDNLLGRSTTEGMTGIYAEQDQVNHSVSVKIEINICFGISIPEKADEIQSKVSEEITKLTGVRVSAVHVIFRNLTSGDPTQKLISTVEQIDQQPPKTKEISEYSEEF